MARSIQTIQAQIVSGIETDTINFPADFRNNPSSVSKWNLWTYIVAVAISLFEQLLDLFKSNIEAQLPAVAISSLSWLQQQILLFQWDATTPQIVTLVNYIPTYAVVDPTKRIITNCSIQRLSDKSLLVKVISNGTSLTSPQIAALQSYIDLIFGAGSEVNILSVNADELFISADIYYNGLYSASILSNVEAALNNYLNTLDFNGQIKVSDIENVIRNTTGVNDVKLYYITTRKSTDTFTLHGNNVIYNLSGGVNMIIYQLYAGDIVMETTSGSTWADTLNFIIS